MSPIKLFKRKTTVDELLTIDDLKSRNIKLGSITMKDKKNVKILFVDDEGYDTELLQNLGYLDIQKMYKYDKEDKMDNFEKYDIIFCDINGIAKDLGPVYQGAALAKLIKQTYPEKIVVIFSAKEQFLTFNKYYDYVDDVIFKNLPPAELASKIDQYINKMINPIDFWNNIKNQLLKQDIRAKDVSRLEHYYVKSIIDKKSYISNIEEIGKEEILSTATTIINAITAAIQLYVAVKN